MLSEKHQRLSFIFHFSIKGLDNETNWNYKQVLHTQYRRYLSRANCPGIIGTNISEVS